MNKNQTPQYQSYLGLQKITNSIIELENSILQILEWIEDKEIPKKQDEQCTIKFLDTFFSDTIKIAILEEIFSISRKHNIHIKILVLNPNSQFALSRSFAIKQSTNEQINIALFNIRRALQVKSAKIKPHNIGQFKSNFTEADYILKQLELIKKESKSLHLEIKFYDVLTEAPVYIFPHFLLKGLMLHGFSAAQNPWMLFVDDETQKDDIYDYLSNNFDMIWDESEYNPYSEIDIINSDYHDKQTSRLFDNEQSKKINKTTKNDLVTNKPTITIGDNFSGAFIVGDKSGITNKVAIKKRIEHLSNELKKNKVPQEDIDELVNILESEQPNLEEEKFGKKANNWILKMVGKSLEGTWEVGVGTSAGLLTELLKGFFGM